MRKKSHAVRVLAVAASLLVSGVLMGAGITATSPIVGQSQATTTAKPVSFFSWFMCFFFRIGCTSSTTTTTRPGPTTTTLPPDTGPAGDAFYRPPSPLPPGRDGDVIWYSPMTTSQANTKAWKVLYRSTSATGQALAVSGTVIVPTAPYAGVRPLVTIAPGTQGMADSCAPSKNMSGFFVGSADVTNALGKGFAVAMTDYQGLGTPGDHTYAVGPSLGRSVLDMARAATRNPIHGLGTQTPIGIWGYSEGGGGAGWAAELLPTYAPELLVKGVAAGGVPADLPAVAALLDGGPGFGFLASAAIGFDAAYPELNLDSYLNPTGMSLRTSVNNECAAGLFLWYGGRKLSDHLVGASPLTRPDWQARLAQSKLGTSKPTVPVFLYHGNTDQVIPFAVGTGLRDRYCAQGATVRWTAYPTDHVFAGDSASPDVANWLNDRFKGVAAPNTCP